MKTIDFVTKVYQSSSKTNRALIIILNIAMVIVAVTSLISIFLIGINIANISSIIISLIVVFTTKARLKPTANYLDCYGKAILTQEDLRIQYYKYKVNEELIDEFVEVTVPYHEIQTLEYSDTLKCLRLTGGIMYKEQGKDTSNKIEHLLYIDNEANAQWFLELQKMTNRIVDYIDRH